jgi:hypothetical protein
MSASASREYWGDLCLLLTHCCVHMHSVVIARALALSLSPHTVCGSACMCHEHQQVNCAEVASSDKP